MSAPFSELVAARPGGRVFEQSGPDDGARSSPWSFRATELDLAGHINNAAYWQQRP